MRKDNRYVVELQSGILKNPQLKTAGDDFSVNDVVWLDGETVRPMFDESVDMFGVVAANAVKGGKVLVAAI